MKIAHIFYSLTYGGIETLLVNISNWQVLNNYKVSIILINDLFDESLMGSLDSRINIIQLNRRPKSKSPTAILKLNYYLLKHNYDILHMHSAGIGNFIQPILSSKRILHVHSTTQITNSKLPKYDKCLAISEAVKHTLESKYGAKNISVIYNGINFNDFVKRDSNIITNKIICIGRLDTEIKNQNGIITEFSRIKNQINANLYFVGDGPDMNMLINLIEKLKLKNRVFLLGKRGQTWIQQNLCNYDLFIQASHSEGLGLTAIEAAAACVPLLLSKVDGHLEISENGRLCELFEPNKEGDLGEKVIDFYKNTAQYFNLAIASYKSHNRKFDFELYNKNIIKFYYSILVKC